MAVDADETYLSDLLSYSLERLNKEPEALANEETRLRDGVRDAAVRHYRAFVDAGGCYQSCLLYTSPSPRDATLSRMPSSA